MSNASTRRTYVLEVLQSEPPWRAPYHKLRNDDGNNDDDDDRDAASGDKRRCRPSLLLIQSHPLSLLLNFITDDLIPLFISCFYYCRICGRAPRFPPQQAHGGRGGGRSGKWWWWLAKKRGEEKGEQ